MKIKTTTFIPLFVSLINASAQNSMTNVYNGELTLFDPNNGKIGISMLSIASAFNTRICIEIVSDNGHDEAISFTNPTMGQVFNNAMEANPDYTWRYENHNDTIYVYPKTNALSMMRVGPVSVTNMLVKTIFEQPDIIGLGSVGIKLSGKSQGMRKWDWTDETVSLEFENAFVWQVFDAIDEQLPKGRLWVIFKRPPDTDFHIGFTYSLLDIPDKSKNQQ